MKDTAILASIKQRQATIKSARQPVFQVQKAQKHVQEVNRFVRQVFSKDVQLAIPNDTQASIVIALKEVIRIGKELEQKCKTPQHFEMQSSYYQWLIQSIGNLEYCIHYHIELGFYELDPIGLELDKTLEFSWKRFKEIHQGIKQANRWVHLPIPIEVDAQTAQLVEKLYEKAASTITPLLKNQDFQRTDYILTLKDIKAVNTYFRLLKELYTLQEQSMWSRLKQSQEHKLELPTLNIKQVFEELKKLEQKIKRYEADGHNPLLQHSVQFDEDIYEELLIRFREYYLPLETSRFMRERLDMLNKFETEFGGDAGQILLKFFDKVSKESAPIRYFVKTFTSLNINIIQVIAILNNLSISFGKIYHLTLKNPVGSDFVKRALLTIHSLLGKGLNVAISRQEETQKLQQLIFKIGLFQTQIQSGLLNDLKLFEKAKNDIQNYEKKLDGALKKLDDSSLTPSQAKAILHEVYQDRDEFASASICLSNVTSSFSLLLESLKSINHVYKEFDEAYQRIEEPERLLGMVKSLLDQGSYPDVRLLQDTGKMIEQLGWFIDDVLLHTMGEENRYTHELETMMSDLQAKIIKKSETAKIRANVLKNKMDRSVKIETKVKEKQAQSKIKKADSGPARNPYDPFTNDLMTRLKEGCQKINTERTLSLLQVLNQTHVFSEVMDTMENEFDPKTEFGEGDYMDELTESQNAKDFILGFLRMKFMPYGYFDLHGQRYPYVEDDSIFEIPKNAEPYIKFTQRTLETPRNIFRRLLRVMLGYDEADVMSYAEHEKIIEFMKEDHILSKEEQVKLKEFVPFIP